MLERLYAIKRPFDFRVSLQRHRSPVHRHYYVVFKSKNIVRWSRVIIICWVFALLPAIPLIFNSTIENNWENKSNCKCFYPLDDVSISPMSKYLFTFTQIFAISELRLFFTENLDVLDVFDKFSDSFFADLPHLGGDGASFLCQSTHVRQQQVFNLIL